MGFAMTVLIDELIIVGGAIRVSDKFTNKLLVFESGHWKDYTQMPTARGGPSAVTHQSMMIVMGGIKEGDHKIDTIELLDSTIGQWFKCDDLPQPLARSQSVIVGDTLYTLGGLTTGNTPSKAVYAAPLDALPTHQLKWQQLPDAPWNGSAAVSVNNKCLLAVGGGALHDTVCVLKEEKGLVVTSASWKSIGSLPNVHIFLSAVSLPNQIIIIGGGDNRKKYQNAVTIGTFQQNE